MSDDGDMWRNHRQHIQKKKEARLRKGEESMEELVALDFSVFPLSEYHFRINYTLDVWPSTGKWHDRSSGKRGTYSNLLEFVKQHFNGTNKIT